MISPGGESAPIFTAEDTTAGCLQINACANVAGSHLDRQFGWTNLPTAPKLTGDLAARKTQAADLIAAHGEFEPSVAALLAARGDRPELVQAIVRAALVTLEERHDCSDFSMMSLLRLWVDARDTLPKDLAQRLHRAFLGYRYWLDEPGDDVMWFWSENHVLCFHAAQLIAGDLFGNETFTFGNETFTASGRTGCEQYELARKRLDTWFGSILTHGLCEFNSAAYYPIDLLGLLTLHDLAPAFRDRAREVIDRIFIMAGLHSTGGVPAGCQGRCYEKSGALL